MISYTQKNNEATSQRSRKILKIWQYVFKGGRMMLIKSILGSIPTYFMSVHYHPGHGGSEIGEASRDFLCGGLGGV